MKKGAVGIGTLIIFIAMVLVAAIAAAVLINVSGILQQRAMTTGKEAIQQVSSNIVVHSISAYTADNAGIDNVSAIVSAAAGAGRIDLRYMIIRVRNDANESYLNYTEGVLGPGNYTADELRDPAGVFSLTTPVIDGSALVAVHLLVGSSQSPAIHLVPRSNLYLVFIPEHGTPINIATKLPESFSTAVIEVYP